MQGPENHGEKHPTAQPGCCLVHLLPPLVAGIRGKALAHLVSNEGGVDPDLCYAKCVPDIDFPEERRATLCLPEPGAPRAHRATLCLPEPRAPCAHMDILALHQRFWWEEMQQDLECLENLLPFAAACLIGYALARFPIALVPSWCLRKNAKPGVERRP